MMQKITKRNNFNALLAIEAVNTNPQLVEFINHEIELLNKKSERKGNAVDANAEYKAIILEVLGDKKMTASEIQRSSPVLAELSSNKVNGVIRQMKLANLIVREEEKRKAYFSRA